MTKSVLKNYRPAVKDIANELARQRKKWGVQNHEPMMWLNILMEEVGEASQAMMEAYFRGDDQLRYREEMVQVAAVALSAIECFDRLGVLDKVTVKRYKKIRERVKKLGGSK